ncbi:MAG: hypothetical protein IKU13_03290 [Clostridia bacterium]|nr:hypothetical protein [Clostridia bacterium]MBR5266300.1 hypothetical protein [Clostridia bacterium]
MDNKRLEFLTNDDFGYIIRNEKRPFVIFFMARWDENSKNMMWGLENIGHQYYDNVRIYAVDIDETPLAAAKSNIISIPCITLYIDGVEKTRSVGVKTEEEVIRLLKNHEVI